MVDSALFSILVGTVLGFLTGLGTGGGSLLVLWLTLVLQTDPQQAKIINLMFFLPAAVISTVLRWYRGGIPFRKILLPALAGCVTAALFSFFSKSLDVTQLQKLFGILLIFTGIRELFYRPRNAK